MWTMQSLTRREAVLLGIHRTYTRIALLAYILQSGEFRLS